MINRRSFLSLSAGLLNALPGAALGAQPASGPQSRPARPIRGVTLAGGEFGTALPDFSNETPGQYDRDYTFNSERTVQWFAQRGFGLFRIPFRWERIQPKLGAALDADELERLRQVVRWAGRHDAQIILDVHNFGRYTIRRDEETIAAVIDQPVNGIGAPAVTRDHFADLWRRLSRAFQHEAAVWGYGLMNEPHDLGESDWKGISQSAVDAIRARGDQSRILVSGADWSGAGRFDDANGTWAWIRDPAGNVLYEAHCYFDEHASGFYEATFDQELARDPGLEFRGVHRLIRFAGWCAVNGVGGFVGEYGVPGNDPRWLAALSRFLAAMDEARLPGCCWAAGEWWPSDEPLSLQPRSDFTQAAPQLKVIARAGG